MSFRFPDRRAAGEILAGELRNSASLPPSNGIVLALPRGGVPVAREVARALSLPLDVFIVRKLGVPGHEELAMGAIASGGGRVLNLEVINNLCIREETIEAVTRQELDEVARREILYRPARPPPLLQDRPVILVDDGLATGSTMRAAVAAVRSLRAAHILVAVPVAAPEAFDVLAAEADAVVCPLRPASFHSVGEWYADFTQTTDEEVRSLLILDHPIS